MVPPDLSQMKATLFSLLYWILVVTLTTLFALLAIVTRLLTFPFDKTAALPHANGGFWARLLLRANPAWTITLSGALPLDSGPYVIVANHQSQMDILVICLVRHHFKWISKASMFSIPILGWAMRACGYISLLRGDKESIASCMATAASWIRRGVSVLFFPEGTRSPDGTVRPFKLGAFRLASETGVPILPITISGTDRVLPKGGWKFVDHMQIHVHVNKLISPPSADQIEATAEFVRAHITAKKAELDLTQSWVRAKRLIRISTW